MLQSHSQPTMRGLNYGWEPETQITSSIFPPTYCVVLWKELIFMHWHYKKNLHRQLIKLQENIKSKWVTTYYINYLSWFIIFYNSISW